jgi:hypothetical protein
MIIEKAKRIVHCLLLNLKGIFLSDGMGGMSSMRTVSKFSPSISRASTMCLCRRVIVNLVPLLSPRDGVRFRSNMITAPTYSFSS